MFLFASSPGGFGAGPVGVPSHSPFPIAFSLQCGLPWSKRISLRKDANVAENANGTVPTAQKIRIKKDDKEKLCGSSNLSPETVIACK